MIPVKKKLLVVDDVELNRILLKELFCEQFEVLEAANGQIAFEIIQTFRGEISIVLLDLVMPVMDGFDLLKEMNRTGLIKTIPVIMITGEHDDEKVLTGHGLGVSDLVRKPFNPDIIMRRVNNVVDLYAHKNHLEQILAEQKAKLEEQAMKIRRSNQFIIDALSAAVESRSSESGEHIKRIRVLTRMLLEQASQYYPLAPNKIEMIYNASATHDIGKIAIPDAILLKPGPLTQEEFEIMKTHTIRGCEILASLDYAQDEEYYTYCYDICRYHHERWDGQGYPDGLQGDEIPIWAQATSIADVYDALTNKRVYKDAYSHVEAVAMILQGECGQFNPILLECFRHVKDNLNKKNLLYA